MIVLAVLAWGFAVFAIAILIVEWFILDKLIKLLGNIKNLAALYFPQEVTDAADKIPKPQHYSTNVQINDPLEWKDVDEKGNDVVPRD